MIAHFAICEVDMSPDGYFPARHAIHTNAPFNATCLHKLSLLPSTPSGVTGRTFARHDPVHVRRCAHNL